MLTGLTARQLQWWDERQLLSATVPSRPTEAGGFTERRYSPIDLYELSALAELRRRGFTLQQIRKVLLVLKETFGIRLFEALDDNGPVSLRLDGVNVYAQTRTGAVHNLLQAPEQPLLVVDVDGFEVLGAKPGRRSRRKAKR